MKGSCNTGGGGIYSIIIVYHLASMSINISPYVRSKSITSTQTMFYVKNFGTYTITATDNNDVIQSKTVLISSFGQYSNVYFNIPPQYQQVEYLATTNGAKIMTNVYMSPAIKIETDFMWLELVNDSDIIGAEGGTDAYAIMLNNYNSNHNRVVIRVATSAGAQTSTYTYSINTKYSAKVISESGYLNVYINNVQWNSIKQTVVSPYPLPLFGRNVSGSLSNSSKARIYKCQISDGSVLIRNFIPCYRKSDNVAGMWDTVTNIFYTNVVSGGSFTVGDNVL